MKSLNAYHRRIGLTVRDLDPGEIESLCRIYNVRVDRHNYIECWGDLHESDTLKCVFGVEWAASLGRPCTVMTSVQTVETEMRYSRDFTGFEAVPLFAILLNRRKNHREWADGLSFRKIYIKPSMMLAATVAVLGPAGEAAFQSWLGDILKIATRDYWSDWSAMPAGTDLTRCGTERGPIFRAPAKRRAA